MRRRGAMEMEKEKLREEEPWQLKCIAGCPWAVLSRSFYGILSPKFCDFLLIRFSSPPQQPMGAADWLPMQGPLRQRSTEGCNGITSSGFYQTFRADSRP
jgi:hypothetical protein